MLADWSPASDEIPTELRALLPEFRCELDGALTPATVKQRGMAAAALLEFSGLFGAVVSDPKAAADVYIEAFADLPLDLLRKAVAETRRTHRYNAIPRPGDVIAHVSAELSRRKDARQMARWCQHAAERQGLAVGLLARGEVPLAGRPPLSPETEAMLAEAIARGKSLKRLGRLDRETWTKEAPVLVKPRPDLVKAWAREMGVETPAAK